MDNYIVTIVRAKWYQTDYIGTFSARSPVQALSKAGRDGHYRQLSNKRDLSFQATKSEN